MTGRVLALVAGGAHDEDGIARWAASATHLYAADGAAAQLCALGYRPTVVGDLDSAGPEVLARAGRVVADPSQETTDCDKLLRQVAWDGFDSATLAGVEGDRLDHVLATLGSAARSGLRLRVLVRQGMGWVVRPGQPAEVAAESGATVSLLPLVPCSGVALSGVRWPLDGAALALDGAVSVSNEATGPVGARVGSGAALLVVGYPDGAPVAW